MANLEFKKLFSEPYPVASNESLGFHKMEREGEPLDGFAFNNDGVLTGYTGETPLVRIPQSYSKVVIEEEKDLPGVRLPADRVDEFILRTNGSANVTKYFSNIVITSDISDESLTIKSLPVRLDRLPAYNEYLYIAEINFTRPGTSYITRIETWWSELAELLVGPVSINGVVYDDVPSRLGITSTKYTFDFSYRGIVEEERFITGKDYTVRSIGPNAFNSLSREKIIIPNSVTSIASSAFEDSCFKVVVLSDSITTIPSRAFRSSTIESIRLPVSLKTIESQAFMFCDSLTQITLPESLTTIESSAFRGTGITGLNIPKNVSYIENPISYCNSLESIIVSPENTAYDSRDNCNAIIETGTNTLIAACLTTTIPDGTVNINGSAFNEINNIQALTIPASVTTISGNSISCSKLKRINIKSIEQWFDINHSGTLFYGHGGTLYIDDEPLTNLNIPSDYNSIIGPYTFSYNYGITSASLGGSTGIGNYAFQNCSSLTSITIPSSVTSIGNYAFSGCSGLTSITISEGVTSIGNYAFIYCSGLTSITIPSSVTSIGSVAFEYCSGLTSITISEGVTSIGSDAFNGCSGLTSIVIPRSVKSIGNYAFYKCSSLTTVRMEFNSSGIANIPTSAFYGCTGVTVYDFAGSTVVPTLSSTNYLGHASGCEIRVPSSLLNSWKTATNWSSLTDVTWVGV